MKPGGKITMTLLIRPGYGTVSHSYYCTILRVSGTPHRLKFHLKVVYERQYVPHLLKRQCLPEASPPTPLWVFITAFVGGSIAHVDIHLAYYN